MKARQPLPQARGRLLKTLPRRYGRRTYFQLAGGLFHEGSWLICILPKQHLGKGRHVRALAQVMSAIHRQTDPSDPTGAIAAKKCYGFSNVGYHTVPGYRHFA
jgi:hypothetical protein